MYEIPKNLNKYEDEFIPFVKWNFRQFIYFLILMGSIAAIYHLVKVGIAIKLTILVPFSAISVMLIHLRFDEKLSAWLNQKTSLHNVGYYDSGMDKFIPIASVQDNTVYLKDGTLLAIIEVKPIDFSILADDEKESVLFNYRGFLKSLDFPLQICCRSADVNLTIWLSNLKKMVLAGNHNPTALERIDSLTKWIEREITETNTRNRLFYIIVPYHDFSEQKSFVDSTKELFLMLLGRQVVFTGKRKIHYEKSLKELSNRGEDVIEKITKLGVKAKRMNSNKLLSLYTTYFTDMFEIDTSYLTPVMWYKGTNDSFDKFVFKKVFDAVNENESRHHIPENLNIDEHDLHNEIVKKEAAA